MTRERAIRCCAALIAFVAFFVTLALSAPIAVVVACAVLVIAASDDVRYFVRGTGVHRR